MIDDLQRLNPTLGLRLTDDLLLAYDGTAHDVFTIRLPEPPTDELLSGLTHVNRESMRREEATRTYQTGPRRIERTADGHLLVRPRSWDVEVVCDELERRSGWVWKGRLQERWGVFRGGDTELWEADWGVMPDYFGWEEQKRDDSRVPHNNHDYWRTTPIGTICYIDRHDLPIETHFARARAILAQGSEFAVVGDLEAGEVNVFRLSGVERHVEEFQLPELPGFSLPIGRVKKI